MIYSENNSKAAYRPQELNNDLLDSFASLMHLFSLVPSGIFQTTEDGTLVFVNEEWYALSGRAPELCLGKRWYNLFSRESSAGIGKDWRMAAKQNLPFEFTADFKSGEVIQKVTGKIVRVTKSDENSGFIGAIQKSASYPLSEQLSKTKKSLKSLRRDHLKLLKKIQYKDKLISALTHETNNRFLGITGLAELLHNNISRYNKEDIATISGKIEANSAAVSRIFSVLLELNRIQSGRHNINPAQNAPSPIIQHALKTYKDIFLNRGIKAINSFPQALSAFIDPWLFETILNNIFSFLISTQQFNELTVSAGRSALNFTQVKISVDRTDMPKNIIQHLFTDENILSSGTGKENIAGVLELRIIKEIAELLDGEINSEKIKSGGLLIRLSIPKSQIKARR